MVSKESQEWIKRNSTPPPKRFHMEQRTQTHMDDNQKDDAQYSGGVILIAWLLVLVFGLAAWTLLLQLLIAPVAL